MKNRETYAYMGLHHRVSPTQDCDASLRCATPTKNRLPASEYPAEWASCPTCGLGNAILREAINRSSREVLHPDHESWTTETSSRRKDLCATPCHDREHGVCASDRNALLLPRPPHRPVTIRSVATLLAHPRVPLPSTRLTNTILYKTK